MPAIDAGARGLAASPSSGWMRSSRAGDVRRPSTSARARATPPASVGRLEGGEDVVEGEGVELADVVGGARRRGSGRGGSTALRTEARRNSMERSSQKRVQKPTARVGVLGLLGAGEAHADGRWARARARAPCARSRARRVEARHARQGSAAPPRRASSRRRGLSSSPPSRDGGHRRGRARSRTSLRREVQEARQIEEALAPPPLDLGARGARDEAPDRRSGRGRTRGRGR